MARSLKFGKPLKPWTPFIQTEPPGPPTENQIRDLMKTGKSREEVVQAFQTQVGAEFFENSRYLVIKRDCGPPPEGWPRMFHLSIKRHDRLPVGDERFRDFQRIKNELVGPECEAVELYPAESRLVDGANQYHLWVLAEGSYPFGFQERLVIDTKGLTTKQKPFDTDDRQ